MATTDRPMIRYQVKPISPEAHLFQVELSLDAPAPQGQELAMPAWILGSYMIRDFAKNIVTIEARCGDETLELTKLDKQRWRCAPCTGELRVRILVYAWDLSVRSAHLDQSHGYFNGTSLFLRVVGREGEPCEVEIAPPDGNAYSTWRIATTLPGAGARPLGFGHYRAADYEELTDHPVEMGSFSHATFEAGGVPHEIAITGRHEADLPRLCADLERICSAQIRMFGEPAPMERYLFQVMAVGDGYGGLEHRASTSLLCSRNDLPRRGQTEIGSDYRRFLGLCSHEYFHLWNVKRIRPAVFAGHDLAAEAHTGLLWAFEGITSYYDDLFLRRSGLISDKDYLELLAQSITRVLRSGGRRKQTLLESSFDAWTKFYKQDENAPNAIVSYYAKGALVALALDLTMRQGTDGRCSLDDLMRALWEQHGKGGIGVEEDGVERLAAEVSGFNLEGFFDQALRSTEELPLEGLFESFGIGYRERPARDSKDQGGVKGEGDAPLPPRRTLGIKLQPGGEARLQFVFDGGAAQRAGLAAGDQIVAVNELRAGANNLDALVNDANPERPLRIHAFRRDELLTFNCEPLPAPADTCDLWLLEGIDDTCRARRDAWLQGD